MKNFTFLLLLIFPVLCFAQKSKISYLNFDGKEISYYEFQKYHNKGVLVGQNDDGTVYRLIKNREKSGKIKDYTELVIYLNNNLKTQLDFKKPLFIYYYPGPDVTNISRNPDLNGLQIFKDETNVFENKLQKTINGQTLFVFKKESTNVYEGNKFIDWKKDPNHEIEKRFFSEFHHQFASFVIIFPNGDYNAYFGEFSYNQVFDYVKNWKKMNK
ncbi:hypothetical protein P3875_00750 [Myroides sp. JBRI-B21084]|uniref:hypothetical protein n=1 Tax=Myroides sp. JBRI-B21084 TaxID=3119977 RepID=UPI0026E193C6|nr:hypothetical protein [Paenimyroides cloacae]WKW46641.1 hypothetical protein P3875_00750 [Paenimyroides cloacae]